jgi:hypothetical protein
MGPGLDPTGIGGPGVLVPISIGVTVPEPWLLTYAVFPFGVIAMTSVSQPEPSLACARDRRAAVWEASVMSSWSAGAQWLTVAGSSLLTLGTWAQARASLIEYRDLFADLPQAARTALESSNMSRLTISRTRGVFVVNPAAIISEIPRQLQQIRQEHGEVAARAAQLIRLAAVWSVLAVGAVLILAASVIQLVLAYA